MTQVPVQTEIQTEPKDAQAVKPVDLQPLVSALPGLARTFLKLNSIGSITATVFAYALGATIIVCATTLALKGIIEGQAIAGFLGAAIGYVFAKAGSG